MKKRVLLSNGLILTMSESTPSPLKRGYVGVEDGRITFVSHDEAEAKAFMEQGCDVVDCTNTIVMPGLINTHCHVAMTIMRNMADDMELMTWLTQHIWPFEAKLTPDDISAGAQLGIAEMLMGGTTTFVDMYWNDDHIARAVEKMGIRALLTECVLDGREESFLTNMDALREVAAGCSRVMAGVGPHAPYTCSPATLQLAKEYATKHNLPLTIHLNETASESAMIEERHGCSAVEYINRCGLLDDKSIFAHSVYMSDHEIEQLAASGASVAHNAQSNMKLASGVAPIAKMARMGVNCTIATDGASSNNDLDMWEEMRTTQFLQRVTSLDAMALPAYEVLRMATVNGARAIGMEGELGELKVGALADIIAVDCTAAHMRPLLNPISALVYCAKASDVKHVVVDGVLRVKARELVDVDLEAICVDVEQRYQRLAQE